MSYTYLHSINIGQSKNIDPKGRRVTDRSRQKELEIAPPKLIGSDYGSLTLIAGRNRTGKSHLLRHADRAVTTHNERLGAADYVADHGASSANVWVRPINPTLQFASSLLISDVATILAKFQSLAGFATPLEYGRRYAEEIQRAKEAFFIRQLSTASSLHSCLGDVSAQELIDEIRVSGGLLRLSKKFEQDNMYRLDPSCCGAVTAFEQLSGGRLFFRFNVKVGGVEPILSFGRGEALAFGGASGGWSQGQKVAFAIFILVEYLKPEILFVDELETHLHPEYISALCRFIRSKVAQTVLVSHHPHLIFSSFVDKVWFFEVEPNTQEDELVVEFPRHETSHRPPPKRKITLLDSDYERIAAAYALFDGYDHQLLNFAGALSSQLSAEFFKSIEVGLDLEIAHVSGKPTPDTQTNEIAAILRRIVGRISQGECVRVLDYGAGRGRTLAELLKTNLLEREGVDWHFYEINELAIGHLKEHFVGRDFGRGKVKVLSVESELEHEQKYHVVIFANVLHECSPTQIGHALTLARRLLANDGVVLIAELFPLLSPERFGIAYSEEDMLRILNICGFSGFSVPVPIRSGFVRAYTFLGQPGNLTVCDFPQKIRAEVWSRIRDTILREYAASFSLGLARNAVKLASQLHTLASIEAFEAGLWE